MDKLIITATVDCKASYPGNPYCPDYYEFDKIAKEYADCVSAGASIVHLHGPRKMERSLQPDGRQVAILDLEGWKRLHHAVVDRCPQAPIVQFGSAASRLEPRIELMKLLHPDMMSVIFTAHDEHFHPDPAFPPTDIVAIHPRSELQAYVAAGKLHGVKLEVECFHPGALYNLNLVDAVEPLPRPLYITLFLGWPGGTWMPPTPQTLTYMIDLLPVGTTWNLSVMDPPAAWQLLTLAITLGGHVRVGWEDNPYVSPGRLAEHCHELVDKIAALALALGRDIATPNEAREIIFGVRGAPTNG
jgi:3-keto-5-aminohexanoate cleavage enzyme